MALPTPNLDDRSFAQLVQEAREQIIARCPSWTDLSPGDPGITLLEVFAYLTETMIYRLNRLPNKAYIEFLRLLGVKLLPPTSASAIVQFKLAQPAVQAVEIPGGTRVTCNRQGSTGEPAVFVTRKPAVIAIGSDHTEAVVYHCQEVRGELAGIANGAPGQTVTVARCPVVAPSGDDRMLLVGVEALPQEISANTEALAFEGKTFQVWREVETFAEADPAEAVYVADRSSGLISFAPALRALNELDELQEMPAALAAVPRAGRQIRLWYGHGGGAEGNVPAGSINLIKDQIPGVTVTITNTQAATGGRAQETLENLMLRGPQELHSLRRAVTARDFELLARRSGGVSRARAFTRAQLWTYAAPGTVEVILVPAVSDTGSTARVTSAQLRALENQKTLDDVQAILEDRRPLGTTCLVNWVRYKTVQVQATVIARPEEDPVSLKKRVLDRLHASINPLPAQGPGWDFGKPLDVYTVYLSVLSEPGVLTVQNPRLVVEDVPEKQVVALAADYFQPDTWYAASEGTLFRTTDNGDAWEPVFSSTEVTIRNIICNPWHAGRVAFTTRAPDQGSRVYVSKDCGEQWEKPEEMQFDVSQAAWVERPNGSALLMATSAGLYELSVVSGSSPVQVFVTSQDEKLGYYAVAVSANRLGAVNVVVAMRDSGGVYLSRLGAAGNTFRAVGLASQDVRVLAFQEDGERTFLWAGLGAPHPGDVGEGCRVAEVLSDRNSALAWEERKQEWMGGSCLAIRFRGGEILAATYDSGVLSLAKRDAEQKWVAPTVQSGLPLLDRARTFEPVQALAISPDGSLLLAGGKSGVFRSTDDSVHYTCCSQRIFADRVSIPWTWVFCSGEHQIEVVALNEKRQH